MQHTVVSWKTIHEHGHLWWQHLEMRKRLFVDEMGWEIPHTEQVEADQYDTPLTRYIISHANGVPLAASRLNPTIASFGSWSYMINDACKGKLPGIPFDLMEAPPKDPSVWEATRFTVDPSIPQSERNPVLAANAVALADAARNLGATNLIALMPPAYIRWLTSLGLQTTKAGPVKVDPQGKRICVMQMAL